MLEAIEAKLGYKLDPSPVDADVIPDDIYRDHVGVTPQKQEGLSAIGASVLRGRLTGDQLHALADLADKHGDGHLRATIMQNLVLVNIRNAEVRELLTELKALDINVDVSPFWRGGESPARAQSSANLRLQKPRASHAGWWTKCRAGCRASTSKSSCT